MLVKHFVRLLTFFAALVSSNGLKCAGRCSNSTVNIILGSDMLLPCSLRRSNQTGEANWSHNSSLLRIRPDGNIKFEDCRDGRVTVFPYLFSRGNFSILIHRLQASDLGTYCCQLSMECHVVELKHMQSTAWHLPWYYIVAGIGGLILLLITCSLVYEFRGLCVKKLADSYDVNSTQNQGANPPGNRQRVKHNKSGEGEENDGHYEDMNGEDHARDYETMQGEVRVGQHEDSDREEEDYVNAERGQGEGQYINSERADAHGPRGQTGHHRKPTVYENNEHDPSVRPIRQQPPNRDFRETQSQPQSRGPYYVNQSEICNPGSAVKRKKKQRKKKILPPTEYQFRNPIYGDNNVEPNT
ncbi:uncharacterized protein [Salminus brasiliensis]|uniref:uncharacterized protein n=1 Tax=Salminus brasiliensis TaxID=930266 RepID=UPI003B8319EA